MKCPRSWKGKSSNSTAADGDYLHAVVKRSCKAKPALAITVRVLCSLEKRGGGGGGDGGTMHDQYQSG